MAQQQGTGLPQLEKNNCFIMKQGAIIRGDTAKPDIALVFTGDEFFEGLPSITQALEKNQVSASFFLTGRLYRNPDAKKSIHRLMRMNHYLGPHSDQHLLYNDWSNPDSLLVSRDSFSTDLQANYRAMEALRIRHQQKYFIPPYEWWNATIARWCRDLGITVISFSPGTATNADYTFPEMGMSYRNSDTLMDRLLAREEQTGLNGAMILIHIGTDPRRTDKLYDRLPELIRTLKKRGYRFLRVDELLRQ
jgi:peptidoglycan/xylan/chitin deacetylase (PgdA/CDA1 family)